MADPVRFTIHLEEPLLSPVSPDEKGDQGSLEVVPPSGGPSVLELEAGQEIRGTVEVDVYEDVDFREAQIRFLWHTEGKGNRATGEGGAEAFERDGHWVAGTSHRFPFTLRAPRGPLSYHGKILRVVWALEARLDRSLLRSDVTESLPVFLRGSPDPEFASLGPVPQETDKLLTAKKGMKGLWVAFGLALLLIAIVVGALKGWQFEEVERWFVSLLIGGGFLLILKGIWGRLGKGKLGEPTVQLSTSELRRGEEIRFSVALRPEKRTELRTLEAILECEERVVHGHGQYQSHHRRIVFEQRLSLVKDQVVEAHRGLKKNGSLTLPTAAAPSFGAPYNQVVWWLRFQGDIVGWPDWKEPFLLTVWP